MKKNSMKKHVMKKKSILISIAIAIIFVLFIGYGIEVFNPNLDREDFCPQNLYEINSADECLAASGEWNQPGEMPRSEVPVPVEAKGFCGPSKECYDGYQNMRVKHDQIVFIAAIIIGLISAFVGIMIKKDDVGMGLLGGSLLLILYGTIRYWQHANSLLKFILLGIALAVLIWIAYKKLDKKFN